jgi:tetratricopeptide (TPR) repeat protein
MLIELIEFLEKVREKDAALTLLNALSNHAIGMQQCDELSQCYFKLKKYEPAIIMSESAYKKAETPQQEYAIRANLINLYNHANQPEKAMELIDALLQINPNDIDIILEKAFSLFLLNRKNEAEEILLKYENFPGISHELKTKIKFNLGTYAMYRDEFIKGLSLFLLEGEKLKFWRKQKSPLLQYKFWEGGNFPGENIVLNSEAGIGDEIVSVRFMKHLKEKTGMEPIWFTDRKDMVNIFNRNGFKATTDKSKLPKNGYWAYPMSLPIHLNLEYKDLWDGPYLKSLEEFDQKYKWMNQSKKLKIGLRWQGNPEYDQDLHRCVNLSQMFEAIKSIDADFYSIQRDNGLEQLNQYPEIKNMENYMTSYEETMSILNNLDIVITTCTSIAHMSAAMGKRTFIFIPITAYYTWSHSMKQSPWYGDNVTLLRQEVPRDWTGPVKELIETISKEV